MSTRRPGKVTALVVTMPCSLPNVTNDPVSETPPIRIVNATTPSVHGLSACAISTSATRAAAPPPTPLKAATSCGIWVICTRRAAITAITEPTTIAPRIQARLRSSVLSMNATTASAAPAAPSRFARRAVRGLLRPLRARMNSTAAMM